MPGWPRQSPVNRDGGGRGVRLGGGRTGRVFLECADEVAAVGEVPTRGGFGGSQGRRAQSSLTAVLRGHPAHRSLEAVDRGSAEFRQGYRSPMRSFQVSMNGSHVPRPVPVESASTVNVPVLSPGPRKRGLLLMSSAPTKMSPQSHPVSQTYTLTTHGRSYSWLHFNRQQSTARGCTRLSRRPCTPTPRRSAQRQGRRRARRPTPT